MPKGLLRGLQAEHPVIRWAAVEEAFRFLGQHTAYQSRDGAALLQQCLSASDAVSLRAQQQQPCVGIGMWGRESFRGCACLVQATVEEAVRHLVSFVPKPGA